MTTLIPHLREVYRQRQDLLTAENSLNHQIDSICRRMTAYWAAEYEIPASICAKPIGMTKLERARFERSDDTGPHVDAYRAALMTADAAALPLVSARDQLHADRLFRERQFEALSKQLPVWEWTQCCRGLSALSLGQIIGETGDLSNYANPAKVWKRLGLGIVDGQRQRKTTNADLAVKMGYNPRRRSVMWVVGDNLIRCRNPEYYAYYVSEKERLAEKWPEATKLHLHRAAHRHMEKRFVRDLWRAWRPSNQEDIMALLSGQAHERSVA